MNIQERFEAIKKRRKLSNHPAQGSNETQHATNTLDEMRALIHDELAHCAYTPEFAHRSDEDASSNDVAA